MDPELTPVLFHEWQIIIGKLRVNQRIEDALEDFARRSGVEEISSFAQIIQICKRTEGNIAKVIENTAGLLQEKIEIQGEVQVALAKKKMEQKILNVMPVAVLSLLLLLSPDYLAPLYSSSVSYTHLDVYKRQVGTLVVKKHLPVSRSLKIQV